MTDYDPRDFAGPESGYLITTWADGGWRYRPVKGGPWLTDAQVVALGLQGPLTPEPTPEPVQMIAYTQRDERWASVHLGASAYTMGGAGCAVTSCAIFGSLLYPDRTPLDLVEYLNLYNGFTSGGLLYWARAADFYDGLTYVTYKKWTGVSADMVYVRSAIEHNPQIVQVDFHPGGALDTHFVVAASMTADGLDINIIDPWTGKRGTLLGEYGIQGWTLERAVYALAEFRVA